MVQAMSQGRPQAVLGRRAVPSRPAELSSSPNILSRQRSRSRAKVRRDGKLSPVMPLQLPLERLNKPQLMCGQLQTFRAGHQGTVWGLPHAQKAMQTEL